MVCNIIGRSTWSVRLAVATIAIVGSALLLGTSANAAPLALAKSVIAGSAQQDGDVTLVRDGCGQGMRWSNGRQMCVEAYGGGPVYQQPVGCPPGTRFSERMQTCVEFRAVDPGAAIVNGIINGVLGGGGCPPGTRFSERRQACVGY